MENTDDNISMSKKYKEYVENGNYVQEHHMNEVCRWYHSSLLYVKPSMEVA